VFLAVFIDMFGINTVKVLYWSQVLAGIVLVPIFFYILALSNNREVMKTINSRSENLWLGFAVTAMLISNLLFLWSEIFG
jgi:Mn2+/Fe2+ NRAMP family transporter